MRQFCRSTRSTAREVELVDNCALEPTARGIDDDAGPVGAAADDEQVVLSLRVLHFLDVLLTRLQLEIHLDGFFLILDCADVALKLRGLQDPKLVRH